MGIFQGKLEEMYDNSEPEKLSKMMLTVEKLEAQARNLSGQAHDIQENIKNTIERRLKVASQEEQDKYFSLQMKELAKQWQLMAASMCKVQRSVLAKGFHSSMDLYVNKTYGFKEYKRFSGWNPFEYINPSSLTSSRDEHSFEFKADQTMAFTKYSNHETLNFKALYKVPQFDSAKVTELSNLTNDILRFMLSWKQFYVTVDYSSMEDIKRLLHYGSYSSNGPDYKRLVFELPKLVEFKDGIIKKLEEQSATTQPIVDRWKEANKNFVVLNELAKKDLNI